MFPAKTAVFFHLELVRGCLFVLAGEIILPFTLSTFQMYCSPHCLMPPSMIYTKARVYTLAFIKSLVLLSGQTNLCKVYFSI
jgi:hypothetical protein